MIRKPVVAGRFYPGTKAALAAAVEKLLPQGVREEAIAVLSPHAGYMFSGGVAGSVYSSVKVPDRVILMGPNHTGLGAPVAVAASGQWEIPLGKVTVDEETARELIAASHLFSRDMEAHLMEHSLEVQLPFIYAVNPRASIVPITVMRATANECEEMGRAIAGVLFEKKGATLIVASTDMNHYEPDSVTRKKDSLALEKVLALDARGLLDVAAKEDITMCGVVPSAIAIFAARALGARHSTVVKYATSGDVNGETKQVVGYAGVVIR